MHELAITQEIVKIVVDNARGAKVLQIEIEIGKLSCVSAEAVQFCFDMVAEGTVAEGAKLLITQPAGLARCKACAKELALEQPFGRCECGCSALEWLSGEQMQVMRIQLADDPVL